MAILSKWFFCSCVLCRVVLLPTPNFHYGGGRGEYGHDIKISLSGVCEGHKSKCTASNFLSHLLQPPKLISRHWIFRTAWRQWGAEAPKAGRQAPWAAFGERRQLDERRTTETQLGQGVVLLGGPHDFLQQTTSAQPQTYLSCWGCSGLRALITSEARRGARDGNDHIDAAVAGTP